MPHCIAKTLGLLLRLLDPPRGRHRLRRSAAVVAKFDPPTLLLPRGADEVVRPYVLPLGEWQDRRELLTAQRERRRALWLASYGIDVGPSRIHGVEVAR
ncbi:hypothetical protein [Streptomyces sp. B6B3]|uniref:hypothetical protein n=1 Tax=Streptomyces sp. B6B3 TaxID=3153570 RepID=UPI00325CFF13